MATVGKWNGIKFKTNAKKLFTFGDMERTYSAEWKEHPIIGKRPKMEYTGIGMDEITINVILDGEFGVKPRNMLKKFRTAAKKGIAAYFYVGGKKVVSNKMYIGSGAERWKEIWNKGELVKATATLTFKEYR